MDKALKEVRPVKYSSAAVKILHFSMKPHTTCFKLHWHDRVEFIKVNKGQMLIQCCGNTLKLKAGEMALFPPKTVHGGSSETEAVAYDVLMFDVRSFYNETENGKLYISYPMVEALRDFEEGKCGKEGQCFVPIAEIGNYKFVSAERSFHPGFKDYDIIVWKSLIEVFAMRLSCLVDSDSTITYEQYADEVSPVAIYRMEEEEIQVQRVFVLSAFPEFLLDYFGVKLWRTCVKHTGDLSKQEGCK